MDMLEQDLMISQIHYDPIDKEIHRLNELKRNISLQQKTSIEGIENEY